MFRMIGFTAAVTSILEKKVFDTKQAGWDFAYDLAASTADRLNETVPEFEAHVDVIEEKDRTSFLVKDKFTGRELTGFYLTDKNHGQRIVPRY